MASEKEYDIVVFGGTGFTGKHVVRELLLLSGDEQLRWGIAGRSLDKMRAVIDELTKEVEVDQTSGIGLITADINDIKSIHEMCASTRLLLNCVGPYYKWGRQVVEACIEESTHYLDISGEPFFMEQVEADYHEKALQLGIVICSACGFDSVPGDVGVRFLQKMFPGTLTSVETYLNPLLGDRGFAIHLPTFECNVNGFAQMGDLRRFRRQRALPKLPKYGPVLRVKQGIWRESGKFAMPFAGADHAVVMRTQRLLHAQEGVIPVQAGVYMTFQDTALFLYLTAFGIIFISLVFTRLGRWLLMRYPRLLTLGAVTPEGATDEQIRQSSFTCTLQGIGYSGEISGEPDTRVEAEIVGPDPGYVSCSRFLTQAAFSVLKIGPRHLGVVTPGAMLDIDDYVARLQKRDISFKITKVQKNN